MGTSSLHEFYIIKKTNRDFVSACSLLNIIYDLFSEPSSCGPPPCMATVSSSTSHQTRPQSPLHCQDLTMGSAWCSTWSRNTMDKSPQLQEPGNPKNNFSSSLIQHTIYRVTVHSRDTPPLIEDNRLMIEPNMATDIAIERVRTFFLLLHVLFPQKVKIKREPPPYGTCFTTWTETGMNKEAFEMFPGTILPYTQGVI